MKVWKPITNIKTIFLKLYNNSIFLDSIIISALIEYLEVKVSNKDKASVTLFLFIVFKINPVF